MTKKYKYHIVQIQGEWIDLDDALTEWGDAAFGMIADSFEIEVEAENWLDAKNKIIIAAEALEG